MSTEDVFVQHASMKSEATDVPQMYVHVFVAAHADVLQEKVDSRCWSVLSRKFVVAELLRDARLNKDS